MALPATDTFTTGSDQDIESYSANWTENSGDFQVVAATDDVYQNDSNYDHFAHWNADAFNNDQYAQIVVNAITTGGYIGPAVRVHASAQTGYEWTGDGADGSYLVEVTAGSGTQLGNKGTTWSATQTARLEAEGTTITPMINAAELDPPGAQTDSTHSSGYAGITGGAQQPNSRMDNWEGGNLGAAPARRIYITHM